MTEKRQKTKRGEKARAYHRRWCKSGVRYDGVKIWLFTDDSKHHPFKWRSFIETKRAGEET